MKVAFSLFIILHFFLARIASGQERLLTIPQVQDSMRTNPKPVMLMLHTDWCNYCALQKQQLSKQDMSDKVYFAEFNAECKEKIFFNGKEYYFKPAGKGTGLHELATLFAQGKSIAFPMWVILDEKLNVLDSYTGYLKPDELKELAERLSE